MKKYDNTLTTIEFEKDIDYSVQRKPRSSNLFFRLTLIFFGTWACLSIINSFFDFSINMPLVMLYTATFLLFAAVYFLSRSSILKNAVLILLGINIIFFLFHLDEIKNGVILCLDKYLLVVKKNRDAYKPIVEKILESYNPETCIIYASIFVTLIVALTLVLSVLFYTNFIAAFIITFPFFEIGMYWGILPNLFAFLAIIIFWVCVMSMQLITFTVRKGSRDNIFSFHPKSNTYYFTSSKERRFFNAQIGTYTALVCALTFSIVFAVSYYGNYNRPVFLNDYRQSLNQSIQNFSFEEMVEKIKTSAEQLFNFNKEQSYGGINNGHLGNVDNVAFNDVKVMEVTVNSRPQTTIYLKGFSAGNYTGNSWTDFPDSVYNEYESLFDASQKNDIFLGNLAGEMIVENWYPENTIPTKMITINNISANYDVLYYPYNSSIMNLNGLSYVNDTSITSNSRTNSMPIYFPQSIQAEAWYSRLGFSGQKSFSEYDPSQNEFIADNQGFINKNSVLYDIELEYRDFVFDNYLDYDKDLFAEICYTFENIAEYRTLSEIISEARQYVWKRAAYSLSPGKTPADADFIDYFLYESGLGYCSHFASAGVVIFRAAGIPAKYCEGFICTPSSFSKEDSIYSADILDNSAHAWVEIYISGIGWVPVEMTPGGYVTNDNPNSDSSIRRPDSSSDSSSRDSSHSSSSDDNSKNSSSDDSSKPNPSGSGNEDNSDSSHSSSSNSSKTHNENENNNSNSGSNDNNNSDNDDGEIIIKEDDKPFYASIYNAIRRFIYIHRDIITFILLSLLSIAAFVMLLRIKHRITVCVLRKRFSNSNRNRAVIAMYCEAQKLTSAWGVSSSKHNSDLEILEELILCNKTFSRVFIKLYELSCEAKYSDHILSEDDYSLALKTYNRLVRYTGMRLNSAGRLIYKFFLGISLIKF